MNREVFIGVLLGLLAGIMILAMGTMSSRTGGGGSPEEDDVVEQRVFVPPPFLRTDALR